jgi:DNA-binding NarL/FixJ family response regulator
MGGRLDAAHADDGGRRGTAIPGAGPLRVVIADDHRVYRQGLARLLTASGIDVVAQAADGLEAIELVEEHAPDVAVIDLNMPGLSGAEVTRRLIERNPASRVLVVSVSAQEQDVTDAILAGASGYVLKDGPVEEVVAGIRAAAAGESLISPRVAAMLLRKIRARGAPKPEELLSPLSARELEVLQLVSEGKANHEIAEALVIDESTVRNHISSILMKLRADHRVQAAVRAVRDRML